MDPYPYTMSFELETHKTPQSETVNSIIVENNMVFQQIISTKNIVSEKQLEYLIDWLITTEGFTPEIKGSLIYFTKSSDEEVYTIDKDEMKIEKVRKNFMGELESM